MINDNEDRRLLVLIKQAVDENAREYIHARTRELLNKKPLAFQRILKDLKQYGVYMIYKKSKKGHKLFFIGSYDEPKYFKTAVTKGITGPMEDYLFCHVSTISEEMALVIEKIIKKFLKKK